MNFASAQDFNCLICCQDFELTLAIRNTLVHDARCYYSIKDLQRQPQGDVSLMSSQGNSF